TAIKTCLALQFGVLHFGNRTQRRIRLLLMISDDDSEEAGSSPVGLPRNSNGRHNIVRQKKASLSSERSRRLCRILTVFLIFATTSLYKINQHSFLINSFPGFMDNKVDDGSQKIVLFSDKEMEEYKKMRALMTAPLEPREWDRMLFGIFTYDSPNEADIRAANRETHLSYFKQNKLLEGERPDTICSLKELLNNATLARDLESCRVVYSFVMGGGVGDDNLRKKVTNLSEGRNTVSEVKTRCLWEDPECGGTDITKWTLDTPKCNVSNVLAQELKRYDDITLLSIPENHELGKTDTWFTYASMLTRQHPELQIGFIGKTDSDVFVRWPLFFWYLQNNHRKEIEANTYIYGGYAINKKICKGNAYGRVCLQPNVIFTWFAAGAMAYMSTPLAQHAFMDGTTLERKREVWIVGEDMQLANMAYSDPTLNLYIVNHRYRRNGDYINQHCFNDPALYRREYYKIFPDQRRNFQSFSIHPNQQKNETEEG
ncbi:hypothetical protein ACHAXR_007084, partial [Thalassiosira sp. AJA248-18]